VWVDEASREDHDLHIERDDDPSADAPIDIWVAIEHGWCEWPQGKWGRSGDPVAAAYDDDGNSVELTSKELREVVAHYDACVDGQV